MKRIRLLVWIFAVALMSTTTVNAQDQGIPDTVRFETAGLALGQSLPVDVYISNDEELTAYFIGLLFESIDTGFARFDSAVWVGRLADPSVLQVRGATAEGDLVNGPYDIRYGALATGSEPKNLPAGAGVITRLYLTGVRTGNMSITGVSLPNGGTMLFVIPGSINFTPTVVPGTLSIGDMPPPPIVTVSETVKRVVAGGSTSFTFNVSRPAVVNSQSIELTDSPGVTPVNPLIVTTNGTSHTATWLSTSADVGIWTANVEFCDSAGLCSTASVEVQVVSSVSSLVDFSEQHIPGFLRATGFTHGNFDTSSASPEIIAVSDGLGEALALQVYDVGPGGQVQKTEELTSSVGVFVTPQVAFINADNIPDLVTVGSTPLTGTGKWAIQTWEGSGASQLSISNDGLLLARPKGATVADFNNDAMLDLLTVGKSNPRGNLFTGNVARYFDSPTSFSIGDSALSVSSGDFNDDGLVDIAVGTITGLEVYLNQPGGDLLWIVSTYIRFHRKMSMRHSARPTSTRMAQLT